MDKETEKFLGDVAGDEKVKDAVKPEKEDAEELPDDLKNRQIKRLLKRREEEKQSAIELADKVRKAHEEIEYLKKDREGGLKYKERFEKVIGNDTAEKQALVSEMAKIFEQQEEELTKKVDDRQRQSREKEEAEEAKLKRDVDDMVANVEDKFDLDLTSETDEANTRYDKFMSLVKKMSPKDAQGNLTSYADFEAVAEIFKEQESKGSSLNRKKEIASRGSSTSASVDTNKSELSAQERWLKQNGILPSDFKRFT